ncbi:hypothetical protein EYF80_067993 [Liparis tanakae]|uniref:Uncharacterized protein n=1 Tax=Liparis tanakae TaxID=230148 RepID=A0A4Z2DZE2_9TELE|nr:hypothetical protein EYF80_067993 [Liparis tanakae]
MSHRGHTEVTQSRPIHSAFLSPSLTACLLVSLSSEKYSLTPQIHEPANERLPALPGSRYSQRCRVFVPCVGRSNVFVVWKDRHAAYVLNTHGLIYTARARSAPPPAPAPPVQPTRDVQ